MTTPVENNRFCHHVLAGVLSAALAFMGAFAPARAAGPDCLSGPDCTKKEKKAERAGKEADSGPAAVAEDPARVQKGDLVTVSYTVRTLDGKTVLSTSEKVEDASLAAGTALATTVSGGGPEGILAGKGEIPLAGLDEAVIGMKHGEKKTVVIPPEKGAGPSDPKLVARLPLEKRMPRRAYVSPRDFVSQFDRFPVVGDEVPVSPYFSGKVAEVTSRQAVIESSATDGAVKEESFGTAKVAVAGEEIVVTLEPRRGSPFDIGGRTGIITGTGDGTFTVDFNPPIAGKELQAEIRVESLAKASTLQKTSLPWQEDPEAGLEAAKKAGLPAVMVLYADWCGWSKRLLNDTMTDPRVTAHKDRFVWIRTDSGKNKALHDKYGQKGFPLVLILGPDGSVLKRLDGFQAGKAFSGELRGVTGS